MKFLNRRVFNRFPALPIGTFIGILHLLIAILGAGVITIFSLYFIYKSGEQASMVGLQGLAYIVDAALETPAPIDAHLNNAIDSYLKYRPEVRYTLLRPDGSVDLASISATRALSGVTLASPEVQTALAGSLGRSIHANAQGQRMIYVATNLQQGVAAGSILVLGVPLDQAMQPTYQTMRWLIVIAVLIVLFTVAEGWLGSIYISRPLVKLSHVAETLSQGDLTARAEPDGPTEVIHLAQTLNEMAARVQNSLESLHAFVGNASHELRTPLTSIRLQVNALTSAREEPEVAERFMGQIEGEIDRLEHTVNDMLDLSQIEGGGSRPRFQPVNMADLASEVQAFWQARAHLAGLSLAVTTETDLPEVRGDPYQLRRLMDNLLDNAIKYTPSGGKVEISLRRCPALPGKRYPDIVRLEVQDNGPGIALDHLPHVFDRFYRIESHTSSGYPKGSGLGLAIARSIVLAHGGKIGVNSLQGAGSTFWVELPVQAI